jgi:dipeptidyl aminopeptidase/acylaminoacyl peptidase
MLLVFVSGTALADPPAPASAPPSVKAFSHTPGFTEVALSPDGTMLAMDEPAPPDYRIIVIRIKDGQRLRAVAVDGNNKLRSLYWADDKTVLMDISVAMHVVADSKARENWEVRRTFAIDLDGDKPRMLLMDSDWDRSGVTGATLQAIDIGKPGKILMSTLDWSATRQRMQTGTKLHDDRRDTGWSHNLYEVDLATGRGREIATGTSYTSDWVVGLDGTPVARSEWNGELDQYSVLGREGDAWNRIFALSDGEEPWLAGMTADGRSVVMIGENGTDRSKAWGLPLDGSPAAVLYEDPEGDVVNVITDPRTRVVVAYLISGGETDVYYVDEKRRNQAKSMSRTFAGKEVTAIDRSRSGRRILVRAGTPAEPPIVYLVDFDRGAADIVGEAYPELVGVALGKVRAFSYPARDGTSIPAFLTLPPGVEEAKNLPLVVMPHGGPHSHDSSDFDWFSQFLASRGYAVLQPQFRGSTGYGKAHREAGRHQWGGLMQDDVTDGSAYLVKTGAVDPRRICIVGASYGGYSALAGAAFTPDLYACAISINGVSDLPKVLADRERRYGSQSDLVDSWREHIGAPTDPQVIARSPARAAANVRAPVLLLHGTQDTVVPILQSEVMDSALTAAGKPHKFVRLDGEDHWLSRASTREQVLTEVERFLATNLKPQSP